jgi:hypothetical protein
MKKSLLMLILFIGSIATSVAQNIQEVVYLKNGSIIRGIVIEQVPNASLKIQTSDGSIFAYPMSEVIKITKETVKSKSRNGFSTYNNTSNQTSYKGFVDLGYTIGVGVWGLERLELSTSHGFQFNPHLYVGAGIAANYYFNAEAIGLPIFAHVRGNILNNSISPYVDFRIGYSPLKEVQGLYMNPSIGCKIHSFNVSMGYVMQRVTDEYLSINCGGFSIKIGYEF